MLLTDLQNTLLETLRGRVRNGEMTERRLAKLVGVSQPHMHNVLKGYRELSPKLADQILRELRLSIFDLVDRDSLNRYLSAEVVDTADRVYIPMLRGRIGPGFAWPTDVEAYGRFLAPRSQVVGMTGAVAVLLGEDVRMHPTIAPGDIALLDQSRMARTKIDPNGLYVVKRGRTGAMCRLRKIGVDVYIASEDSLERPAAWERIDQGIHHVLHVVRARAVLIAQDAEWKN